MTGKKIVTCGWCEKEFTSQGIESHENKCRLKHAGSASNPGSDPGSDRGSDPEQTVYREAAPNSRKAREGAREGSNGAFQSGSFKEDYMKNRDEIEPKKEEKSSGEPDYQCGACNAEIYRKTRPKFCPDCGTSFE